VAKFGGRYQVKFCLPDRPKEGCERLDQIRGDQNSMKAGRTSV
jgi:hypothetical protein